MKKQLIFFCFIFVIASLAVFIRLTKPTQISGSLTDAAVEEPLISLDPWQELKRTWKRPEGPVRVGLQIGHLHNDQVPEELENLKGNTGAAAGGFTEVQVNQVIAEKTAELLRAKGIVVDILPATIPPKYSADVFIAIHADGSTDSGISGFKIASPRRDLTEKSSQLVSYLEQAYSSVTALKKDDNITRNMVGYYAFNWRRYEHSIHPMTPAAIVETGFLTNRSDRALIAQQPAVPAQAIAQGILHFLGSQQLIALAEIEL